MYYYYYYKKKTLLQENIPNGELNVSGAAGGDAASWALGSWRAKQQAEQTPTQAPSSGLQPKEAGGCCFFSSSALKWKLE